ncbi:hypothetical protein Ddye_014013 [Dipteronia dyeriana]|uniref:Reverse transcriptase domain-containing protein n=1 Tax=Dipteronia dyeriana TaxID=168575 RepID=A0AAD9X7F4_9ROSI|nr:hypothetical protein Ddye_014013 [Dipteronia dyeriana]
MKWCISTPTMSILVNESTTSELLVEKRLRQGDPLSLFLFNLVVECLSVCLSRAGDLDLIRGFCFDSNERPISHLQYADDTILFLEPNSEYLANARRILHCFKLVSGLKINFHKSCVVRVRKNGGEEFDCAALFKCKEAKLSILYLGMPLGARPSSQPFWNSVMSHIKNQLAPWKIKYLSKGRRLALIKSVLESLPTYFMSVFQISVCVAKTIEKSQRSFFWDDGVEKRKLHTVAWVTICNSKKKGWVRGG